MRITYKLRLSLSNVSELLLPDLRVGDGVVVWSKEHLPHIYLYSEQGLCGSGQIARLPKEHLPELAANYEGAAGTIQAIDGTTVDLLIEFTGDDALPF